MIGKILLTLAVILVAWLVVRNRQKRMTAIAQEARLQAPTASISASGPNPWKWAGYLLVAVMILGSGLFLYAEWQDRYRIVTVRVVNTDTGQGTDYRAHRMDVEDRRFITLEGLEVSVADNERIELRSAPVVGE
jgi:hypothetical protein